MRKTSAMVVIVVVMGLVLGACGNAPVTVSLEMSARLEGNALHIDGTTDLPDGALLAYEARHERYDHDPETPEDMIFTDGTLEVAAGAFQRTVDLSFFDPGEVHVWVSFQMNLRGDTEQPGAIRSRFGDRGEHLTGPNVTDGEDGGRRVAVVQTVER